VARAAVLAFGFCLLTSALGAEIDALIASAPGHDAYPEAGALVLLDRKVVTVDKNNSATMERYLVVKIFEDRGRDDFGEITQKFNKDGQTVEVLEARTHKPDGSVVKPEALAISDVSAPEVFDAMAYTNAMLKVVSFPALEKDAVIEYRVRVKPKKSEKEDGFSGVVRFGGLYPAEKREFTLVVPKAAAFKYAWSMAGVDPRVETLQSQVSYTWTLTNTPQIIEEPGMPDIAKLVPVLSYSSYKDWKQVADKLKKEFDKGLVSSPEIKRLADSLTTNPLSGVLNSNAQGHAAQAIYLYVTQKFRSVALDYGDAGYDAHKPAQVLSWKYGDCRDKNCLLISLLRAAGIKAFPVVLSRVLPAVNDVPSPDAFDWLATMAFVPNPASGQSAIENRESPTFLDPFAEYYLYGTVPEDEAGSDALYLDGESGELTLVPGKGGAQSDLAVTTADLTLAANGDLSGTVRTEAGGFYDGQIRSDWRDQTPTDRKRAMAQTASGIKTGAQIDSFWFSDLSDLTKPVTVGFRFTAQHYAVTQKGELSMRMPTPGVSGEPLFGIASGTRRINPVETRPTRIYVYKCNIKLPPGLKVDILPDSVAVSDTSGSSEGGWAKTADGVSFYYAVRVIKEDYSAGEFPKLKAAIDAITRPQFREVYFLK
jgi:transglutaminase-like putative cysteine protease